MTIRVLNLIIQEPPFSAISSIILRRTTRAGSTGLAPLFKHLLNLGEDSRPGVISIVALSEELIVVGLSVTHMGPNGKIDHGRVKCLGVSGPTHAIAVLSTGVFGNLGLSAYGARRIVPADRSGKSRYVFAVLFSFALGSSRAANCPEFGIAEAGKLGLLQSVTLYQQALALVTPSSPAPLEHDGAQRRELPGSTRERCIAGRQKLEMVQIGAG
jgi:hypothetical protein